MNKQKIKRYLNDIGLALNASHNTVATDNINASPEADKSWRIDHAKEISKLGKLEEMLLG